MSIRTQVSIERLKEDGALAGKQGKWHEKEGLLLPMPFPISPKVKRPVPR